MTDPPCNTVGIREKLISLSNEHLNSTLGLAAHSNYEAWIEALRSLDPENKGAVLDGYSITACENLVRRGVPEEKIIAIFTLLFCAD